VPSTPPRKAEAKTAAKTANKPGKSPAPAAGIHKLAETVARPRKNGGAALSLGEDRLDGEFERF